MSSSSAQPEALDLTLTDSRGTLVGALADVRLVVLASAIALTFLTERGGAEVILAMLAIPLSWYPMRFRRRSREFGRWPILAGDGVLTCLVVLVIPSIELATVYASATVVLWALMAPFWATVLGALASAVALTLALGLAR